jgi:hypothetical protein
MRPQLPRDEALAALANTRPFPSGTTSPQPQPETPTPPGNSVPPASSNRRDAQGRFAKGNPGGPGNPYARKTAALRKALVEAVTPEDITAIVHALLLKAKQGKRGAGKLLSSYLLGKPRTRSISTPSTATDGTPGCRS